MVSSVYPTQNSKAAASSSGAHYLENLSKIIEQGYDNGKGLVKYSAAQVGAALDKIKAREYMAFGNLAAGGSTQVIKKYAEAYVNYYNKLSPEEQKSARYNGTREMARALIEVANMQMAEEKKSPASNSGKGKSEVEVLRDEMLASFQQKGINVSETINALRNIEKVSISKEARKLAARD